ncbi:CDP-diacylglycerol--glycerol-3-phosphate 3-phosphatidyltransferase [Mycoplasmatota bacterium]|nr:CDP-diacylglycerol--glycerol-3-phosphate 3-phosphatidyltransferase [Mycoplasmatota bacterium]
MNLPNKLTLFRIFMIPLFVIVFYIPVLNQTISVLNHEITLANIIGIIIFAIAAYTDRLDGQIARKENLVTTFGKFMDPLADKLLVTAALLIAIELRLMPAFIPILIISREFMVTGIRLLAISEGKVIAASPLGKLKTVSQIVLIIALFLFDLKPDGIHQYMMFTQYGVLNIIIDILMTIATLLTLISGYDYLQKNKKIIFLTK